MTRPPSPVVSARGDQDRAAAGAPGLVTETATVSTAMGGATATCGAAPASTRRADIVTAPWLDAETWYVE
jgi:hypothetical protein